MLSMPRYVKREKTDGESQIGEGAYGVVYKGIDTLTRTEVALKKIRLELEDEGIPATALREITFLRKLHHENVVRLLDVISEPGRLYLVCELVDADLKRLIDSCTEPFAPELVQSYTKQMLLGLQHCHEMGVMHRDLKPHNLLVSRNGKLKLADFGLSRAFAPLLKPLTIEVVTRWYRAPEILMGQASYTSHVDMWSVGCIVAEMVTLKPLLPGEYEIDQLHKIMKLLGTPSVDAWPELADLPNWRNNFPDWPPMLWSSVLPSLSPIGHDFISRILLYNPRSRLSATKALEHPYLAGIGTGTTLPLPPPYLNWNALGGDKRKAARRAAEQEAVILPAMVAEATNQDTVSASQQELGA